MSSSPNDQIAPLSPTWYRPALIIALILLALQILVTLVMYPFLPNNVASHWNIYGQVDAFSPKLVYIIILPANSVGISIFLYFLMRLVAALDPKSRYRRNPNLTSEQIMRQRRLGLNILKFMLIGLQLLFLGIQIVLLLLAFFRVGNP